MSELKFPCPKCGQSIVSDTANAGSSLACPACHQSVTVPAAASSVPPPPAVPVGTKLSVRKAEAHAPAASPHAAPQAQATSWANRPTAVAATAKKKKNKWVKPLVVTAVLLAIAAIGWFAVAAPMLKEKADKEAAAKAEIERIEADKKKAAEAAELERKNRPVWTLDLAAAKLADKPASGKLHGVNFVVENVTFQKGLLTLSQVSASVRQFFIAVPLKAGDLLPGKTIQVLAEETNRLAQVVLSWKDDTSKVPGTQRYKSGFAFKIEFGQPADSKLPAKLFVAVPDTEQSFLSGTVQIPWTATPASQAPGSPLSPAAQQQTGKKPH